MRSFAYPGDEKCKAGPWKFPPGVGTLASECVGGLLTWGAGSSMAPILQCPGFTMSCPRVPRLGSSMKPNANDRDLVTPRYLNEFFYCKARRKSLTLTDCLDDYVTSNALVKKRSACWLCPQGKRNRAGFADKCE